MDRPSINTQEIIAKVAREHKFLLSEDDPALIMATINQIFVEYFALMYEESCSELGDRMEELYLRQSKENAEVSKKLIHGALQAAKKIIEEGASSAIGKVAIKAEELTAEISKERAEQAKAGASIDRAKIVIASCSALNVLVLILNIVILLSGGFQG